MLFNFLPLALLLQICSALLEDVFVAFDQSSGGLPIHSATIVYSHDDAKGVEIAVNSLASDFEAITGSRPQSWRYGSNGTSNPQGNAIIVSTSDSELMAQVSEHTDVDVSMLEGKWEAYMTVVVSNPLPGMDSALLIAGSDSKGAAFGVYALAEQSGQSPFHYWLDVEAKKHDEIYALDTTTYSGEPAIQYRGLFINDEAPATTGWWSKTHDFELGYKLDTEYYTHVFDLLVRLKANFLWPAMWKSFVNFYGSGNGTDEAPGDVFFTDDPQNQQLADDYGITVSTSHHEPMQRAAGEWNATETGEWSWTTNKDNVTEFMREGVERAQGLDTYYTLGMRGPDDGPIEGDDPISILRDVFEVQRDMMNEILGNDTDVNKVWTIYKEVAQYYAGGLIPDEDVTLMFTDDNWGNNQRLPLANETARSGGVGLYYHLQYVGVPHAYKWTNSNNLAKVLKELLQAYDRDATKIWVINVADIKPMEMPFGFIMDLAWDPSRFSYEAIPWYVEQFCAREFGSEHAKEIASILMEYTRLIARRRIESIIPSTYSVLNYNESQRVMGEWDSLAQRTMAMEEALPEELKSTFFHLAFYPVVSVWNYHRTVLGQGQNYQYGLERRNQASYLAYNVIEWFEQDYDYEQMYNTLEDGKWDGITSQPHFGPHDTWMTTSRDVLNNLTFVQLRQDLVYQYGPVGIYAEGSNNAGHQGFSVPSIEQTNPTAGRWSPVLPTLTRYGPESHFVEIFHRGDYRVPHNWTISNDNSWLQVSQTSGQISHEHPQQTVHFSVNWDEIPVDFNDTVRVTAEWDVSPWFDYIHIPVIAAMAPEDFHGFPEIDGMISIEADHSQRRSEGNVSFTKLPHLGTRTESGAVAIRPYKAAREDSFEPDSAWMEYDFYLFEDSPYGVNATIYMTTGLDTDPTIPMRFKLTADGQDGDYLRVLEVPAIPGDLPPSWMAEVENEVWTRNATFGSLSAGKHTMRWSVSSPEVYLEKIVLASHGEVRDSYLGPPETTLL